MRHLLDIGTLLLLASLTGCAGTRSSWEQSAERQSQPASQPSSAPRSAASLPNNRQRIAETPEPTRQKTEGLGTDSAQSAIRSVSHQQRPAMLESGEEATLTVQGRSFRVQILEESLSESMDQIVLANEGLQPTFAPAAIGLNEPIGGTVLSEEMETSGAIVSAMPARSSERGASNALQLNLPTALSMVGGQHPAVGFAQWRVREAYARLDQAKVLWLPSIQPGFSFHKHDGNYQASDSRIVDVHRNSFQYGLGAGATGAGTTPRPGLTAQFHVADAIFQPKIAQKTAWARGHTANGVANEQLLNVAVGYLELLNSEQDLRIVEESHARTLGLSKLTTDFASSGQGLQADADRLNTELRLVENRLATARERIDVASARLSQALSLDTMQPIVPMDITVVPIELVSLGMDKGTLIGTGLANRPELKGAQALVAAACEQYRRQKYAPFVPSVLLGFSAGGFGGGQGNHLNHVDDRYDFDALLTWEIRNLGLGEKAARRETEALVQQAKFQKVRILDQVAREVAEAHSQVVHRAERIAISQRAIQSAEDSYTRNLSRIRDGQGLPLEVLQSVQALEDARRAYLRSVIEYNEAQFRLHWSLGWPVFDS